MTMQFKRALIRYRPIFLGALFFLFLSGIIFSVEIKLNQERSQWPTSRELGYLPKGEFLKVVSLGYDAVVADLIWLKVIQEIGHHKISGWNYDWLYHALDVVTTLDPKFDYVYQVGSVMLSVLGDRPRQANQLLKKGLSPNPTVWQIPFYLGFNHFFYLQEFQPAAYYMEKAGEIPGRPDYVPFLASRLYVQAQEPEVALEFMVRMVETTKDEEARQKLELRIKEIIIERDLNLLDQAIKRYTQKKGQVPTHLKQLVQMGFISKIPKEPLGGRYFIDSHENISKSTSRKERMHVFFREDKR